MGTERKRRTQFRQSRTEGHFSDQELAEFCRYACIVARGLGLQLADAEDVSQTAVLRLWLCAEDVEVPRAWLRTVVRHLALAILRSRATSSLKTALEVDGRSQRGIIARIETRDLLESLPPRQRLALLHFALGFSQIEIAARLETTPKAVERLIARARTLLRES